jgi:DNA (cytosine-5)-methyltransferase 1
LKTDDLPGQSNLIWASFPCQDLSLAGGGTGLKGDRSGTFWPFWELMKALIRENRGPEIIVLENVCGALTSHGGSDFATIVTAFRKVGYRCGALIMDAALFIPQSRPRLFIIGVRNDVEVLANLVSNEPVQLWHNRALQTAYNVLTTGNKDNWIWWNPPKPPLRKKEFADLIEYNPENISWHTQEETCKLLLMMSKVNLVKVDKAKQSGRRMVQFINALGKMRMGSERNAQKSGLTI